MVLANKVAYHLGLAQSALQQPKMSETFDLPSCATPTCPTFDDKVLIPGAQYLQQAMADTLDHEPMLQKAYGMLKVGTALEVAGPCQNGTSARALLRAGFLALCRQTQLPIGSMLVKPHGTLVASHAHRESVLQLRWDNEYTPLVTATVAAAEGRESHVHPVPHTPVTKDSIHDGKLATDTGVEAGRSLPNWLTEFVGTAEPVDPICLGDAHADDVNRKTLEAIMGEPKASTVGDWDIGEILGLGLEGAADTKTLAQAEQPSVPDCLATEANGQHSLLDANGNGIDVRAGDSNCTLGDTDQSIDDWLATLPHILESDAAAQQAAAREGPGFQGEGDLNNLTLRAILGTCVGGSSSMCRAVGHVSNSDPAAVELVDELFGPPCASTNDLKHQLVVPLNLLNQAAGATATTTSTALTTHQLSTVVQITDRAGPAVVALDDLDDLVSALSSVRSSRSSSASAGDEGDEGDDNEDDDDDEDTEYWIDVDDLIACHKSGAIQRRHDRIVVKYNAKWDGRVVLSHPSQPSLVTVGRAQSCCVASLLASLRGRGDPYFIDSVWWIRLAEEREAARDKLNARACRRMATKPVTAEWLCLVQVCGVGFGAAYAAEPWFAADAWQAAVDRLGPKGPQGSDGDEVFAMAMLEHVRRDVAIVVLLQRLQGPVDRAAVDWAFGVRTDGTRYCAESAVVMDTGDELDARYAAIVASGEHLLQHKHDRHAQKLPKPTACAEGLDEEDEMAAAGLFGDLSSLLSDSSSDST